MRPYKTSAISISSSSGFEEDDFDDDFGGLGFEPPFGFCKTQKVTKLISHKTKGYVNSLTLFFQEQTIFFRTETFEDEGDKGTAGAGE